MLDREGVTPSPDGACYEVTFLDSVYLIDPFGERVVEVAPVPGRELREEFQILLIRYLVATSGGPEVSVEISEKDLPGGVTFFQGPHALHVAPLVKRYGHDPDAFETRCSQLGAVPINHGDRAMRFCPFPQIPVTYVLWRADDEFPASVSVLFDKSISRWFELDMIFTLVLVLTERIVPASP